MSVAGEVAMVILTALWLMLPAYLSNMLPVLVGGGTPIDFGRTWRDGKRILGDGKTWRGLLVAPLLAAGITFFLQWLVNNTAWGQQYGFPGWGPSPWWFVLAYALGLGALTGDATESFIKRRTGRGRGEKWFPWDQLDFIIGALLLGFLAGALLDVLGATAGNHFLDVFTLPRLLAIVILTPALHLLVNLLGYKLGLKEVPW